jgi:acetyl esterase
MKELGQPPIHELAVDAARQFALEMLVQADIPKTEVGSVEDRLIPGPGGDLPIRIYTPSESADGSTIVFFHGGGWVVGDLETHDAVCRDLCAGGPHTVVAVDYRLAPEHKFPAAPDDCLAATRWAAANAGAIGGDPDRLFVAGDSGGGNLAAVTALRARDEGGPPLRGQVLVYPSTVHYSEPTGSHVENAEGYFLTTKDMVWFMDHYLRDAGDATDPLFAPMHAADHTRLPPALVITAEYDPLRDEGIAYAEKLEAAGVPVRLNKYPGMIHGFYGAPMYHQGAAAVAETCAWINALSGN